MGRLVVVNFVSLDGVIQAPLSPDEDRDDGFDAGGWVSSVDDPIVNEFMQETTIGAAGMLLGRRTYNIFAAAWSQADNSQPAVEAMNRMPKYVVTRNPENLDWAITHRLDGDLPAKIAAITKETDGDLMVFGSGQLLQLLAEFRLVDEYRLLMYPIILGAGKRLFGDACVQAQFRLASSVVSPGGVVILTYQRPNNEC